jgi:hypothetical protein
MAKAHGSSINWLTPEAAKQFARGPSATFCPICEMEKKMHAEAAKSFAKLIKKCAFEMDAEDGRRLHAKQEAGEEWMGPSVCGPSSDGHEICQQTANGMQMAEFGDPAYYLLAYTWNDVLDWADRILRQGTLAGLEEGVNDQT